MDPEPEQLLSLLQFVRTPDQALILPLMLLALLLATSALISASEVAFFALKSIDYKSGNENRQSQIDTLENLLENPKKLLATILVSNNFINVAIVILAAFITDQLFDFGGNPMLGIVFQLVIITFILLLFGEVLPKIYAHRNALRFAFFILPLIHFLYKMLFPLSKLMAKSSTFLEELSKRKEKKISVDDLSQALEIANPNGEQVDNKMLEGIVKFGNTSVKQVMTPRIDIVALDENMDYHNILEIVQDAGYSRLPVYQNSFDEISGLLYIKDLLPNIDQQADFEWQKLLRPAIFVPESKKIDDLLQEFRAKRIHMAIVVDEFGGTSGLVTLEDIIEEVVGEINDEFDLEDLVYSRLDEDNFLFEGKIPLHEFLRVVDAEDESDSFERAKGDSDTLAGFIIEISGQLPKINQEFRFGHFLFKIESLEKRRIKRIKVTRSRSEKSEKDDENA